MFANTGAGTFRKPFASILQFRLLPPGSFLFSNEEEKCSRSLLPEYSVGGCERTNPVYFESSGNRIHGQACRSHKDRAGWLFLRGRNDCARKHPSNGTERSD